MSRPVNNDHRNWNSHETLTTDGSGGFGAGPLAAISTDRKVLTLGFGLQTGYGVAASEAQVVGGTVMVCDGSGLGQYALIVGKSFHVDARGKNASRLHLMTPLDEHVVPGGSTLCLVATVGSKIVSGNTFSWGMVVQWFGTTTRGVIADNDFSDCNVDGGRGAIMGFGLCYGGPQPLWNAEYTGNLLARSNGVTLTDSTAANSICNASTYPGPFTRWQTIRRNAISGVALSAAELNETSPPCGTITTANASTDVVVEHNTFSCPAGSTQPPIEAACSHCKVVA